MIYQFLEGEDYSWSSSPRHRVELGPHTIFDKVLVTRSAAEAVEVSAATTMACWCEANLQGFWCFEAKLALEGVLAHFDTEDDLLLFKMRWELA